MAKTQDLPPAVQERAVEDRIEEQRERRREPCTNGSRKDAVAAKQHDKGKLTARERARASSVDAGLVRGDSTPSPVHRAHDFGIGHASGPAGDGVVTGYGHGRRPQGLRRVSRTSRCSARSARCTRAEDLAR